MKKLKGFLGKPIVRGIVKELISYTPIVGEKLSNTFENVIGTGVTVVDSPSHRKQSDIGRWIAFGVVALLLAKGILSEEQITFLWSFVGL